MKSHYIFAFALSFGLGIGFSQTIQEFIQPKKAIAAPVQNQYNPRESLAPLVEDLSPIVVNIDVEQDVQVQPLPFWGMPNGGFPEESQKRQGQGSGFVISSDGYVLTNHHVIDGADRVKVRTQKGDTYDGVIVGTDDSTDIALIKIEPKEDLPFATLGNSEKLRVGDWVVAIGNPFGLGHTVTSGIVSAKERIIGAGPYDAFIQTDASINPGNSGGPLFNLSGEVVAINTAINPRAQGIGFSVPINVVKDSLEDLKSEGSVQRGWLGVALGSIESNSTGKSGKTGILVRRAYPNTPAEKAGLKKNDIIIKFNGEKVTDSDTLIRRVGEERAGSFVDLTILRQGKQKKIKVELGKRPTEAALNSGAFLQTEPQSYKLGIEVAEAGGFDPGKPQRRGLVVLSVSRRGAAAGLLQPGDILVKANGEHLKSGPSLLQVLQSEPAQLMLQIYRNGKYEIIDISF